MVLVVLEVGAGYVAVFVGVEFVEDAAGYVEIVIIEIVEFCIGFIVFF